MARYLQFYTHIWPQRDFFQWTLRIAFCVE